MTTTDSRESAIAAGAGDQGSTKSGPVGVEPDPARSTPDAYHWDDRAETR